MADHNIDNIYIGLEAEGNAEQKVTALDTALEKLETTLENFDTKHIDTVLEKLQTGTGSNAFDQIEQSVNKAAVSIEYLLSDTAKLEYLKKSLEEAKIKLGELAQGGAGYENKDVRSLINQIHRLQKEIDKSSVNLMDFATKPTAPMSRWQIILNSISSTLSKIGNIGSKAFEKIGKSTKKANNSSKNYNKGLRGLLGIANRFLIFGTFFTIQRQISQAFSEGTQNLYQYSKAIDGKFAQSMDRLATSFLYLKNAIGAAVAPIINAFTPALESLIDTVAEFGNKLAEMLAALSGQSTFKKAIKSHKEYAEAVNKTNNALAKFDEINNITTSKGKDELDYGSMFETAKVNVEFKNLNDLGKQLARKLNEQVKKLDEADIGKKIGTKINGALEIANGFISNFNFGAFAVTLTNEITDFVGEIKWGEIGSIFSNLIVGAFDFLSEFAKWIGKDETVKTLTNSITKLIDGIDFYKIGKAFSKLFKNALVAGVKLVFAIPDLGRSLKNAIVSGINEIIAGAITSIFGDNKFSRFLLASGKLISVSGFANGGYPESGQMFIARENGIPEMVGSIGGRTAVANNDQIVEAISIGVYNAYMDAMSRSGGNKQPTIIQINGREVFRAVQDESSSYTKRTGQPAF